MAIEQSGTIPSRKQEHVELCVGSSVAHRAKTAGFERVEFVHNALPELDFAEVSTATTFLGKPASFPLMVSCMTGGYADAERINGALAEVCHTLAIPMGVGSQKQAIGNADYHESFRVVRRAAPHIAIAANIGAADIAHASTRNAIPALLDLVQADALTVHLNPLQELLQPEGTPAFRGVLHGIEQLAAQLSVPVIVKEVGAGISARVARTLLNAGVAVIDVAGAGGTSWAGVELLRNSNRAAFEEFWDWGIPTVDCLLDVAPLKQQHSFSLVASGGITSGIHIAKSVAVGADMGAAARVLLATLMERGQQALHEQLATWQQQLQSVMFLTGAATIEALQTTPVRVQQHVL